MEIKIPKYIMSMLENSEFVYDKSMYYAPFDGGHVDSENFCVGYTIAIPKDTYMQAIYTFKDNLVRFQNWVNRVNKKLGNKEEVCHIVYVPTQTRHMYMQYAYVTIYDPVMKYIEKYIRK